jgi:hypothetical protein
MIQDIAWWIYIALFFVSVGVTIGNFGKKKSEVSPNNTYDGWDLFGSAVSLLLITAIAGKLAVFGVV